MVNEINKPPSASAENARLGERLAASNRNLQEMQDEHRQLVQEMEVLRQRAAELSQLTAQQQSTDNANKVEESKEAAAAETSSETGNTAAATTELNTIEPDSAHDKFESERDTGANDSATAAIKNSNTAEADEDPETAEYIRQKIAEIAAMKSQFRRVQNMIDTTNLIEKHMASSIDSQTVGNAINDGAVAAAVPTLESTSISENLSMPQMPSITGNETEELLGAMLNMFTDFTTNLRGEAEGLRAERDRIRTLKEELMQRKHQS